jgi:hypothetical protein
VILQGLGENGNGSSARGDAVGILYDDGDRAHDDRYAGDGLYSNTISINFKKTGQAVYKEFYISLLEQIVSSTVEIAGEWVCAHACVAQQRSLGSCERI